MSILTDIVGGIAGAVGKAAIDIRTAITGVSPDKQAELTALAANLEAQAQKAQTDLMAAQIDLNKQEAANTNIFMSGWRPFIGWICGLAFGINFLLMPIAQWVVQMFHVMVMVDGKMVPLVLFQVDLATMLPVLLGMLGLVGARSVEKIQGAQGNH